MSRRQPVRITGQRPDECPACEGTGETRATCREMRTDALSGQLYTPKNKSGSGCPDCLGTGKLASQYEQQASRIYPRREQRVVLCVAGHLDYRPDGMETTR